MSEEAVDVVRDLFEATNERDFARVLDFYAEDATLVVVGGITPGTYEGKAAVGEWFGDWFRNFGRDYRFEINELRDLGAGLVYLNATHRATGRASGVQVETEGKNLYRVSGGKVTRVGLFFPPNDPLAPETLREWSDPETD